jgi:excisionase family DNA binding protein
MNQTELSPHSDWLTPKEAAQYATVGLDAIYGAIASRELRCAKIGTRTWRIQRAELDRWLNSKTKKK